MKSKDYEYKNVEENYEISDERKKEIINQVKNQIRKGFIAHYQVLAIGKNDDEWDFLYDWLDNNDIEIRGINGTISGEIENYNHIPKMGQSLIPERLDDEEQKRLFGEYYDLSAKITEVSKKLEKYSDELKEYENLKLFNEKYEEIKSKKDELEKEYSKINKETQIIRNKLIEHNMTLAKWITTWNRITKIPIPVEDKYQMAYIGLIDAVDKFNPNLGFKFSTYACKAIYRRIMREVYKTDAETRQNSIINEQLEIIPEIENQIEVSLGRKPELYEIAEIMGISIKRAENLMTLRKLKEKESLEKIEEDSKDEEKIIGNLSDTDKLVQMEDGNIVDGVYLDEEEIIPRGYGNKKTAENKAMKLQLENSLDYALDTLTDREKKVLETRFGIRNGEAKSLEETGKDIHVTRERVRQIEAKALRKLRHPSNSKKMVTYLSDTEEYLIDDYSSQDFLDAAGFIGASEEGLEQYQKQKEKFEKENIQKSKKQKEIESKEIKIAKEDDGKITKSRKIKLKRNALSYLDSLENEKQNTSMKEIKVEIPNEEEKIESPVEETIIESLVEEIEPQLQEESVVENNNVEENQIATDEEKQEEINLENMSLEQLKAIENEYDEIIAENEAILIQETINRLNEKRRKIKEQEKEINKFKGKDKD